MAGATSAKNLQNTLRFAEFLQMLCRFLSRRFCSVAEGSKSAKRHVFCRFLRIGEPNLQNTLRFADFILTDRTQPLFPDYDYAFCHLHNICSQTSAIFIHSTPAQSTTNCKSSAKTFVLRHTILPMQIVIRLRHWVTLPPNPAASRPRDASRLSISRPHNLNA